MKSKVLLVGLVGLLLMFGLVLASCDKKCGVEYDCSVTIVDNGYGQGMADFNQAVGLCGKSSCAADKLLDNLQKAAAADPTGAGTAGMIGQSAKCNCD